MGNTCDSETKNGHFHFQFIFRPPRCRSPIRRRQRKTPQSSPSSGRQWELQRIKVAFARVESEPIFLDPIVLPVRLLHLPRQTRGRSGIWTFRPKKNRWLLELGQNRQLQRQRQTRIQHKQQQQRQQQLRRRRNGGRSKREKVSHFGYI